MIIIAAIGCGGLFQCPDKSCLELDHVCDGVNDCGDNSDESDINCPDGISEYYYIILWL